MSKSFFSEALNSTSTPNLHDSGDSNLAVISDVIEDCPTGEWLHGGGGGGPKLHAITADPVLEGSLDTRPRKRDR